MSARKKAPARRRPAPAQAPVTPAAPEAIPLVVHYRHLSLHNVSRIEVYDTTSVTVSDQGAMVVILGEGPPR